MSSGETRQIHTRHVPAELHRRAKMRAAQDGVSLNEVVVAALESYLTARTTKPEDTE